MPKKATINFDMEDIDYVTASLITVNQDCYIRKTKQAKHCLIFAIPPQIKRDLELKSSDVVYFCKYSEGYYISFKEPPTLQTKDNNKARKLRTAGNSGTLYLAIPPFIKNRFDQEIKYIKLIHTKGFKEHEWQVQFLFTDCT